jgi:hypothetical protein
MSDEPISPLRQRMIDDMTARPLSDLTHFRWGLLEAIKLLCSDPRWVSVGSGALNQHVANTTIARLGDAASFDSLAGRSFFRAQPRLPPQLVTPYVRLNIDYYKSDPRRATPGAP